MMNVMSKPTEVSPKAQRRRYATSEKLRVLREADACAGQKGALSALLRREGLYSSHLASWRRQRDAGQLGPSPKKRGRCRGRRTRATSRSSSSSDVPARRGTRRPLRSGWCELQKKVSELLGIPLPDPDSELKR